MLRPQRVLFSDTPYGHLIHDGLRKREQPLFRPPEPYRAW